jgi:hypothetical protein
MSTRAVTGKEHETPAEKGCACGIYASDNAKAMATYALPTMSLYAPYAPYTPSVRPQEGPREARVVGFVNLWGVLIECLSGAKGSRAYPESLWVIQYDGRGIESDYEAIATDLLVYGVPVDVIRGGTDRNETIRDFERIVDGKLPQQA